MIDSVRSSISLIFSTTYDLLLNLHSFPTRRSSDLVHHAGPDGPARAALPGGIRGRRAALRGLPAGAGGDRRGLGRRRRSEEHTSELQSRFDLVCRLLLEKKKF